MKTLVVYYSYTGKTKKIAEDIANEKNADSIELLEKTKRSVFNAYVRGSMAARGQKPVELQNENIDFSVYDNIIIAMPIWAGYPAPAINNIICALPAGKKVELVMVSGSGSSQGSAPKTKVLVEAKGCTVEKYQDIKSE